MSGRSGRRAALVAGWALLAAAVTAALLPAAASPMAWSAAPTCRSPHWLFAWAASIVLIVSFFALSVGWRTARFEDDRWRPVGAGLSRALLGRPAGSLRGDRGLPARGRRSGPGLHGTEAPDRNFALTFIFVTVWLGFALLSVLFGDVFRAVQPVAGDRPRRGAVFRASPASVRPTSPTPSGSGAGPPAIGLIAFVWLELVYGAAAASRPSA